MGHNSHKYCHFHAPAFLVEISIKPVMSHKGLNSSYLLPKFSRGPQKLAKIRVFKVDYFDFSRKKLND
jgi:hypothetical protein